MPIRIIQTLIGIRTHGQIAAHVIVFDPLQGIKTIAQTLCADRPFQGGAPTQSLIRRESAHQQGYKKALLHIGQTLAHQQVAQHFKVLNGDRMAMVVIGHGFRCDRHALALMNGLHHR